LQYLTENKESMPYNSLKALIPTAKLKSAATAKCSTKAGSKCLRLFEFTYF